MSWTKKLGVVLVGAALLSEAPALISCRPAGDAKSSSQSTRRRSVSPRQRPQSDRKAADTSVDLAELLTEVPEYQGQGRDLFDFGREPRTVNPPPPRPAATTTVAPMAIATRPPASPRIDLEFAGFIEKTEPGGEAKKYAVLLSGEEILTGAVGDLVANRYKIVEIGLESVTLAVEGSSATQKIPLRTN